MKEVTGMTPEQEQTRVRVSALVVHLVALIVAVCLVTAGWWIPSGAMAVVALVAGAWALKMYGDLQAQAMQDRAMTRAAARFTPPSEFDG